MISVVRLRFATAANHKFDVLEQLMDAFLSGYFCRTRGPRGHGSASPSPLEGCKSEGSELQVSNRRRLVK